MTTSPKTWISFNVDGMREWSGPLSLVSLVLPSDDYCEEAIRALDGKPIGATWSPDDDARPEVAVRVEARPDDADEAEFEGELLPCGCYEREDGVLERYYDSACVEHRVSASSEVE